MTAKLSLLITFRRKTEVNTGLGVTAAWADLGRAWAHRADVGVAEGVAAGAIEARTGVRFVMRKTIVTLDLRPTDVLIDRGVTFQVTGIREMQRRDMLEITAEAQVDP